MVSTGAPENQAAPIREQIRVFTTGSRDVEFGLAVAPTGSPCSIRADWFPILHREKEDDHD